MTIEEYIYVVIEEKYYLELAWWYSLFTIQKPNKQSNKYLQITDNREILVLISENENEYLPLNVVYDNNPILLLTQSIKLNTGMINPDNINTTEPILETTIGRLFTNLILLNFNFGKKILYINKQFSIPELENMIAKEILKDTISIKEYLSFTDSVAFLEGLSRITNLSATYKNTLPPEGIEKKKLLIKKKMEEEHGKNWEKDRLLLVKYQEELKNIDKEWLKDDPSYYSFMNSKIKNNARVKMYLTYGQEAGFNKGTRDVEFVENSLLDQYPKDSKQLTAMFNSIRAGSYGRGKETQKGGTAAKNILRAASSVMIVENDCGSKLGKLIYVTKDNAEKLLNRYYINNGIPERILEPNKFIGKTIILRSPMYCIEEGNKYCSVCVGENMKNFLSGTAIQLLKISSIITAISMKGMHDTQTYTTNVNVKEHLI